MSTSTLLKVIENSRQTGDSLVIMLMLADQANDDMQCIVGPRLASASRMTDKKLMQKLLKMSREINPEVSLWGIPPSGKGPGMMLVKINIENLGPLTEF